MRQGLARLASCKRTQQHDKHLEDVALLTSTSCAPFFHYADLGTACMRFLWGWVRATGGTARACRAARYRQGGQGPPRSTHRSSMVSHPMINLSKGHPTEALYAHTELARASRAAAARMDSAEFSLDYGNEGGSARFAAALAGLLAEEDAAATNPAAPSASFDLSDRLFVTNGVSHALDVISAVLARPGDRCLTEAATYFLAVDIFRSHGLDVDAAPAAPDGSLDVDALGSGLRDGSVPAPQLVYLCPIHSNPTGNTLSAEDRSELVALALEFQFFIIADEVYHFLDWPAAAGGGGSAKPARMAAFDPAYLRTEKEDKASLDVYSSSAPMASEGDGTRAPAPKAGAGEPAGGVVVSVSSFSKILGAGLRLGWIEAAPDVIENLSVHPYVLSGGGVAPFMGALPALLP